MKSVSSAAVIAAATLIATSAAATERGDFLVRLRGIVVAPTESSGPLLPGFPSGFVGVENAVVPELDFTYFLTKHIGAELILASSPHDIVGEGALEGVGDIAEVLVLPPTLTLQYHFAPDAKIRPYVGAGVNYSIFYKSDASDELEAAIGQTSVDLDDSVSWAFQAGVDIDLRGRWFLNADIKYINMDTRATLTTGSLINTVDVDVNPIVAGVGVGYRF